MNNQTAHELENIKQIILDTVEIESIYLFGSYANGTPSEDSDFDLYIVIPDGGIRPIAMQIIGGALYKEQKNPSTSL